MYSKESSSNNIRFQQSNKDNLQSQQFISRYNSKKDSFS